MCGVVTGLSNGALKITVVRNVMVCSVVKICQSFRGTTIIGTDEFITLMSSDLLVLLMRLYCVTSQKSKLIISQTLGINLVKPYHRMDKHSA